MDNLLQEKSKTIFLNRSEFIESYFVYSKGLKFTAELRYDISGNLIVTIKNYEIFRIKEAFKVAVDIHLKKSENDLELISSSIQLFNGSNKYVEIKIPQDISGIFQQENEWLRFIITIKCEDDLYENWDMDKLEMLYAELNTDSDCSMEEPEVSDFVRELWKWQSCSDFIFTVEGEDFPVHKSILGVQSNVFERMFFGQNNMIESTTNRATITDLSADAFRKFLAYIYVRETPNYSIGILDLYKAADKYEIKKLSYICEEEIMNHLIDTYEYHEPSDLISIMEFANLYDKTLMQLITFHKIRELFPNHTLSPKLRHHARLVDQLLQAKNKMENDLKDVNEHYLRTIAEAERKLSTDVNDIEAAYNNLFTTVVSQVNAKKNES